MTVEILPYVEQWSMVHSYYQINTMAAKERTKQWDRTLLTIVVLKLSSNKLASAPAFRRDQFETCKLSKGETLKK